MGDGSSAYSFDSLGNITLRRTTNNDGTITRDHLYYEDTNNPYLLTKYNEKKKFIMMEVVKQNIFIINMMKQIY